MKHKDLFIHYDEMPDTLKQVLQKYENQSDFTYTELETMHGEVQAVGYTFDYYLDAQPYALRPIGVALNEVECYEEL